jgi:ribonuclease HI
MLHAHEAIWKERGLLSRRGSPIKHGKEILKLLEAIHLLKELAVIHCQGHQRHLILVIQGNNRADQKAKQAAVQPLDVLPASILALFPPQEPVYPKYTPDEEKEVTWRGGW